MAALWVVWLVGDWFVEDLSGFWVVLLASGWFVDSLWVIWMVCGEIG